MLVRAKRLGWNQPLGAVSRHDDYEPPAWMDDGQGEWVQGELVKQVFPADEMYRERTAYTIGGQLIDPATIEHLNAKIAK